MLNNDDLAELLESTRDRVAHMGGDTPSAQGVTTVLEGLIAMLRERAPESYVSSVSQESDSSTAAEQVSEVAGEPPPEPRKRVPARFRTAQMQTTEKKDNPLLRPQYADFFNKLIASHKTESSPEADESGQAEEPPPPPAREPVRHRAAQSTVKPQYQDFFDKLVGKQKTAPAESENAEPPANPESAPEAESTREPEPMPEPKPTSKVPESVWSHTPAPFRDETATG